MLVTGQADVYLKSVNKRAVYSRKQLVVVICGVVSRSVDIVMHNGYAPCGIGIFGDSVKGELILVINIENLGVIDDEEHIAVAEPVVLVNICGRCAAVLVRIVDIERICFAFAVVIADRRSHGI